jgi:hypothetical protein
MVLVDLALDEKLIAFAGAGGDQRADGMVGDEPETLELNIKPALPVFGVVMARQTESVVRASIRSHELRVVSEASYGTEVKTRHVACDARGTHFFSLEPDPLR